MLSTNCPAIKFLVGPPVALVPFQLSEILWALDAAAADRAFARADVLKVAALTVLSWGNLGTGIGRTWWN